MLLRELADLLFDRVQHVLRDIRAAVVEPLVCRQQLRPVARQVLEEKLAGTRSEIEDVRPDRGRAGIAGRPDDIGHLRWVVR
jgi:hypothetical protein